METTKTNSNGAKKFIFSIIGIVVLILVLLLVFHFTFIKSNKSVRSDIVPTKTVIIPTDEPLVTPTIVSTSKLGWKKFVFSNTTAQYSFNYPSDWSVVQIGHNNIVRLNFVGHCRVEFSNSENNTIDSQTKVTKIYAGRTFQVVTLKKNNVPNTENFTLQDATAKDGFSTVNAYLLSSNIPQCQETIDQILSSLTFGS